MAIAIDYTMGSSLGGRQTFNVKNNITDERFSMCLEEQMASDGSSVIDRETQQDDQFTGDIAFIKEKGLVAYIMELHAKRLREEVLESMGLTEEALGKMPPEQRAAVEKRIAEEIQKRMAAESLLQKGNDKMADKYKLQEIAPGMGSVFLSKMDGVENAAIVTKSKNEEE